MKHVQAGKLNTLKTNFLHGNMNQPLFKLTQKLSRRGIYIYAFTHSRENVVGNKYFVASNY